MNGIASRVLLDRYEIGARLGRGTSSSVFSGRSLRTGVPVAIKLCTQVDGLQKARFHREAELLSRVMHPNVIRIVDFGQLADGTQIIVTEYVAGQSLEDHLRTRGVLPWREALDLAGGVFSGLEALHDAGIVHRDIKPSNVLIERGARPTVKLIDLGVSRDMHGRGRALTATGIVVGTVAFMAPELIALEPVDERSDLYSAGLVLYEAMTGQLPFAGTAASIAADKLRFAGVSSLPAVEGAAPWPDSLSRFVLSLLRRKPDERPSSAAECVATVRSILVGR